MKLNNASITMLIRQEQTTIEIRDKDAAVTFVRVVLTPEQLSAALSGLALTPCEAEVDALEKIGKKHENKQFEFAIPADKRGSQNTETLHVLAQRALMEANMSDWKPDKYFASQDSFFDRDGQTYARCTIRRWS